MGRRDECMPVRVYERGRLLCLAAPENEDDGADRCVYSPNHCFREHLPPFPPVRVCGMGSDGENCIEEEYALLCPGFEVAVGWRRVAQVVLQLAVNVAQRTGDWGLPRH